MASTSCVRLLSAMTDGSFKHDALAAGVHEGVGGAEIDGEVASQGSVPLLEERPAVEAGARRRAAVRACVRSSSWLERLHLALEVVDARHERLRPAVQCPEQERPERAHRDGDEDERGVAHRSARASDDERVVGGRRRVLDRSGLEAPTLAVAPGLALPDRHRRLERVDGEAGPRRRPRPGAAPDTTTTTAASPSATAPDAVQQGDPPELGQRRAELGRDARAASARLLLVGLVLEPAHAVAPVGVVADRAAEDHHRAAVGAASPSRAPRPTAAAAALRPSHSSPDEGASRSDTAVMLLTLVPVIDLNGLDAHRPRPSTRGAAAP